MATDTLVHLNNHLLVAIDTETTGLDPGYHEIVQIAVIPLDNKYEVSKRYPFFEQKIAPANPQRVDKQAMTMTSSQLSDICIEGITHRICLDLFENWFRRLDLPPGKKLVPLACNWPFDSAFLRNMFGFEAFNDYFHGHIHDVQTAALFLNDWADWNAHATPYPKLGLSQIALRHNVEYKSASLHDALYDAHLTSRVYKQMVKEHVSV